MAKESKSTATPRLRFPEFRKAGAWDRKKLSHLLVERKQRNRELKFGPSDVLSVSGEYGCVNQIELLGRSYAGASVKDYHVVETGDLVYTKSPLKRNPFGIIKENKGKPGIVSTLYAVYHTTEFGYPAFFDHYFSRDYNLNSYLQPIVKKGAKNDMKVNNSAVLSGQVLVPNVDEQRKIAACLTSLEAVIAVQGQKVAALKTYKRGLMQQLFPRIGETLPRHRFSEFRDSRGWKEWDLGDVFRERIDKGFPEKPVLAASQEKGVIPNALLERSVIRDSQNLVGYKLVKHGDFVISLRSFEGGFEYSRYEGIISPAYVILERKQDIENSFFQLFFKSATFITAVRNTLNNNLRDGKSISFNQAKSIVLLIPNIDEQRRIASCVFAIDDLIIANTQRLVTLKNHKKGLQQQLFLSAELD